MPDWINPDGTLGHSLKNKNLNLKTEITVPAKDIRTNNSAISIKEIPAPYPVEKIVEKNLSTSQKLKLNSYWLILTALVGSLFYIFRKPLLRLICMLKI